MLISRSGVEAIVSWIPADANPMRPTNRQSTITFPIDDASSVHDTRARARARARSRRRDAAAHRLARGLERDFFFFFFF